MGADTIESEKPEEITLTYVDPFPPFAFSRSGKSEGFVIEVLDAALTEVDLRAVYVPKRLDGVQRALRTGEADGIAVFAVTAERKKVYDYSDPLIQTGAGLFVALSEGPALDLEVSAGKRVCTPKEGPLTNFIKMRFPEVRLETVVDYPAALEAVARGKADAAALNIHVGARLARELFPGEFKMPKKIFLETPLAVAAPKGTRGDLLERINKGLKIIEEKGTRRRILNTWFRSAE